MDKYKITITENGSVNTPSKVKMTIPEIADLFGIFYQTTKREVRTIEKSGIVGGDLSSPCKVEGILRIGNDNCSYFSAAIS